MYCDFHTHTSFSSDSEALPESQIEKAIKLGMKKICITDHMDIDFPKKYGLPFVFDYDEYYQSIKHLKEIYSGQIDIMTGVELGIQPHLKETLEDYTAGHFFDFIIGSTHLVNRIDSYYPEFWENSTEHDVLMKYFEEVLTNIHTFNNFDVIGHIDYVVRYTPSNGTLYNWHDYIEIIDEILKFAVECGIGIECNTSKMGIGALHCNPHEDIIKRYRELGGEIITLGSDSHQPERLANKFAEAGELLKNAGFKYYTVFKNRKPEFLPL